MRYFYLFACLILYVISLPLLILTSFKRKHRLSIPRRFFPFVFPILRFFGLSSAQRFCQNFTPQVWLHACSYGEVKSLESIMAFLLGKNPNELAQKNAKRDFTNNDSTTSKNPKLRPKNLQILLTTITHTGYTLAKQTYADSENVRVEFLPFEIFLPFYAKCFFGNKSHSKNDTKSSDCTSKNISSLRLLCVFEAELWLNLFALAKTLKSQTMLINARISSRSLPRYRKFAFFYRHIFALIDSVFAQSDEDKSRLESLGGKNIHTIGNLKTHNPPQITHNYAKPNGVLFLAASTHSGEEEIILQAFLNAFGNNFNDKDFGNKESKNVDFEKKDFGAKKRLQTPLDSTLDSKKNLAKSSDKFLAIIPRHPERFGEVARLLESKNLHFTRLSDGYEKAFRGEAKILLVDMLGELNNLYKIADISILGGAFSKNGGHNPLEPAYFENVLISGEHIFNQKALFAQVKNAYIIAQDTLESTIKDYQSLQKSHIDSSNISLSILLKSINNALR
ncbi:3-deoxy-D-manno-octulosonic acid transferase [Helicobacter sp. T3_23-1056]